MKQKLLVSQIQNFSLHDGPGIRTTVFLPVSYTHLDVYKRQGYGSTTIANYESGERLPDLITAYAIAQRYHVEMEKLMEEDFTNREYKEN